MVPDAKAHVFTMSEGLMNMMHNIVGIYLDGHSFNGPYLDGRQSGR